MRRRITQPTISFPRPSPPAHSRGRPKRNRRGVSLIEMLAVIATMSVVGTLSVTTMFLMLRAEGSGAKSLVASVAFSRLNEDFRRDVHAAVAARHVEAGPDQPEQLDLLQPDEQTVSYAIHADRVVRTMHQDGKRLGVESYVLADGDSQFEHDAQNPLIVLVHHRRGETFSGTAYDGAPVRAYRIEAVRGRDHRFDSTSSESEAPGGRSDPPATQDRTPTETSQETNPADSKIINSKAVAAETAS